MMLLFRKSFLVLLLLQASSDNAVVIATTTTSGRQIDSVASAGNTIHFEQDIDLSSLAYRTTIDVISSVPVTVERYNDNAYYLEGQQPLLSNMAKILVTSNCDTSETTEIPNVVYENGTITVGIEGVSNEEANGMDFLEPSYYEAFWTWAGGFCGSLTSSTAGTLPAVTTTVSATDSSSSVSTTTASEEIVTTTTSAAGTECQVGSLADPALDCAIEGEFCQLDIGVCNNKSGIHYGVCVTLPQACTLEYDPVCGCDEQDYSNACVAHGQGVSVSRMGQCTTTTTTSVATEASSTGAVTTVATVTASGVECQIGPSADPVLNCTTEGEFCQLDLGVCNNKSGIHYGVCVVVPQACTADYNPVCGCDEQDYSNQCAAYGQGVSVSRMGQCTTTSSVATESSGGTSTVVTAADGVECQVGPSADPDLDCVTEGEFCQLDTGVCNNKSGIHYGVCVAVPQVCTEEYIPVCGCDEEDYSNACAAHSNEVSVSRMGQCTTSTTTSVATESSTSGSTTISEDIATTTIASWTECQIGPSADPALNCAIEGEFCQLDMGVCNNKSGIHYGVCVTLPQACTLEYDPVCGCDGQDYSNACAAYGQGISVSRMGQCTVTSTVATGASGTTESSVAPSSTSATATVASNTGTTTITGTVTTSTEFIGVGDFPTEAPFSNSIMVPSKAPDLLQSDEARGTSPNSAFNRSRPLSICIASAFLAIVIISVIFPSNGVGSQYLWGVGKFVVSAVAVSTLYSSPSRSFRTMQKSDQGSKSFPSSQKIVRNLQTCSFNVEVLVDSCTKTVAIDAPAGRFIDVVILNQTSELSSEDNCTSRLEANLTFPAANEITLNLNDDNTIEAFEEFDFRCVRAIDGRPFVDSSGGSLLAKPCANSGGQDSAASSLSWNGKALADALNVTTNGHYFLAEYWTQRALGEHASVASFSAFSIALMTNQAPSDLVEGALKAGIDEVRHAKTSFEIASLLSGKTISPGSLPPSSHEFHHDLTSLAMAVAKEGCVDETISAFAAAAEAVHITDVLQLGIRDSKYSTIDRDTLTFIRDELIKIAMDESNHAALAWQTLRWVCSIDSSSCDDVYNDVFDESIVEQRFIQRAHNSLGGEIASPYTISSEWKKIFNAMRLDGVDSESVCEGDDGIGISFVTDNVLRQISHTSVTSL